MSRQYTSVQLTPEQEHPVVYEEHVPGMGQTRAPQFEIVDPEGITICTVLSEGAAEGLLSHLNR